MSSEDYVLVVEDDEDLRAILVEVLSQEGYASCTAASAEEALAFLRAARRAPCLVLLDQVLRGMRGDDLALLLRSIPALARVPVCLLSTERRRVPAAVDAVIQKPIEIVDLLQVIDVHCRGRDAPQASTPP